MWGARREGEALGGLSAAFPVPAMLLYISIAGTVKATVPWGEPQRCLYMQKHREQSAG